VKAHLASSLPRILRLFPTNLAIPSRLFGKLIKSTSCVAFTPGFPRLIPRSLLGNLKKQPPLLSPLPRILRLFSTNLAIPSRLFGKVVKRASCVALQQSLRSSSTSLGIPSVPSGKARLASSPLRQPLCPDSQEHLQRKGSTSRPHLRWTDSRHLCCVSSYLGYRWRTSTHKTRPKLCQSSLSANKLGKLNVRRPSKPTRTALTTNFASSTRLAALLTSPDAYT
jgi:hypothetical protein